MNDSDRSKVYEAQNRLMDCLDKSKNGSRIEVYGSSLQLPVELNFGIIDHAQIYCNQVISKYIIYNDKDIPGVVLRSRKGSRAAHYEVGKNIIAIPEKWGLREVVVLHELTHHISFNVHKISDHGSLFVEIFLELLETHIGPECGFIFKSYFYQ